MSELIVMCGLPGSGKSFYAEQYVKNHPEFTIVSTDKIRGELFGDESDQRDGWLVFLKAYSDLTAILKSGGNAIFDTTNLKAPDRAKIIKYFRKVCPDTKLRLVFMTTPVPICVERDRNRKRTVGEEVILKMKHKLDWPNETEGWDDILYNFVVLK